MNPQERHRAAARAGVITMAVNLLLTGVRAAAALAAGSTAVLADAANSGTDVLATLVVLGGSRIAAIPPDEGHPYGHEKAELVAAKLVGVLVAATGVVTALGAWQALQTGGESVGLIAALVTGASIGVKEILARYLLRVARDTGNQALRADAANQRTDVLASTAALVGALGARFGFPGLDPAMGLLVAGLIIRMGLGLYWHAVSGLMDPAPEPATMAALQEAAAGVAGVISVDRIKARVFGSGIYVDCKVCVDANLTVREGHSIAGRVKEAVRTAVPAVKDVLVHVNPCELPRKTCSRGQVHAAPAGASAGLQASREGAPAGVRAGAASVGAQVPAGSMSAGVEAPREGAPAGARVLAGAPSVGAQVPAGAMSAGVEAPGEGAPAGVRAGAATVGAQMPEEVASSEAQAQSLSAHDEAGGPLGPR